MGFIASRGNMRKGGGAPIFFLLAFATLPSVFAASEPVTCSNYNIACDIGHGALIGLTEGVDSLAECGRICLDDEACNYYTYYDSQSLLFNSACFTHRYCSSVHPCEHCVSEERNCADCHAAKHGIVTDDNLVAIIEDIGLAAECQKMCSSDSDCKFYTYFDAEDFEFPKLCTLLTDLRPPFTDCKHCQTGPKACQDGLNHCYLLHKGTLNTDSLMLTKSSTVELFSIVGECRLKILAVGGGAKSSTYGGGGSGYVEQVVRSIPETVTLEAIIGDGRDQRDTVVQSSDKQLLVLAEGGKEGTSSPQLGGDGYSGGGDYNCRGGMYGGHGEGSNGGSGSGVDISQFRFETFSLTPGTGGDCNDYYGGGGGGVLINQQGPPAHSDQGKGYGGGGGDYGDGLTGVVIMETSQENDYLNL